MKNKIWLSLLKSASFILFIIPFAQGGSVVVPERSLNSSAETLKTDDSEVQRLIVKMKPGGSGSVVNRLQTNSSQSYDYVRELAIDDAHVVTTSVGSNTNINELLETMAANSAVEWVEVDRIMTPQLLPNDEFFDLMWHLNDPQTGIQMEDAWDIATGQGVVIAVIDTGYTNHIDLLDNLLVDDGFDFISIAGIAQDGDGRDADAFDEGDGNAAAGQNSSWHGSHVSGTIAALTDNQIGVSGVAFNAKVLPVRALGQGGGLLSDIADAIIWSSGGSVAGVPDNNSPAQVINLSLGGGGSCSRASQAAVNIARNNGTTVVVAAGNSAANAANFDPASCNGVLTVAATDRNGDRAFYSNFGNSVEIAAPGGDTTVNNGADGVLSTINGGAVLPEEGNDVFAFFQGTSMAAPHVAGVAGLLYELDPNITPDEVTQILTSTAADFPGNCNGCGAGLLDALAAVQALQGDQGNEGDVVDNGEFRFETDTFNQTNEPNFSQGRIVNDQLIVELGGINNDDITNMSGGFIHTLSLDEDSNVSVTFTTELIISSEYENNEFSQILMSVDGEIIGLNGEDFIFQLTGDGNGGNDQTTGQQTVTVNLGNLSAGDHEIIFGAFNNQKTFNNENTIATFENIDIQIAQADEVNNDGFEFTADTFNQTNEPDFSQGRVNNDQLIVELGGINNDDITGMSGGFVQTLNLDEDASVSITVTCELIISSEYENDEFSQVLLSVDGELIGLNGESFVLELTGDGNGGNDQTTGKQTATIDLGQLEAGNHEIIIGAFNNKKTFNNENTIATFEDISIDIQ